MLQQMRKLSKSWVSTVMMGALALSFALWGIGDIFRGRTSTTVASVGSTDIDQTEFSREYRLTLRNLSAQQRTEITQEEARKLGLPRRTLDRMMDAAALANLASNFDLTVSDQTVTKQIQSMGFRGITGLFDRNVFLQQINQAGYSEEQFFALVRKDLASGQLRAAVEDGLTAPMGYVGAVLSYINEVRSAEYVIVTPATVGSIAPPDEKTLAAYVSAHAQRFSTPEYRSVTYAAIGPDDVADRLTVTDTQLREAYEQNKPQYVVPEKRDADQISFPTEADAKAARAKLDAGMTYDALAATRKLSAKAISMGSVARDEITEKDEANTLFGLSEGGISQPVKGPFGWVIVRVRKITPAVNKSFDDVKAELEKKVKTDLAASTLVDVVNKFTDAQGSGDDIAQAGKAAGMHVTQVAAVDSRGFAPDGASAAVPAGDFLKTVFTTDVGVDGDAFQTPDGKWYALKVNGVTPPKLKSLSVVQDAAMAAWMTDARTKALAQKAAVIAADANRSGKLSSGPVQTSGRLARDTANDTFSRALVTALFAKPAGVAVTGPLGKGEGYVVARTTGVAHTMIAPNDPNFRGIVTALSRQIGTDMADALAAAEKTRQSSQINQKLLDTAVGNESS